MTRSSHREARTVDLTLQYRIQLIRCEPTTHFNASAASSVFGTGNGVLHDSAHQFHLDRWENAEWLAFRENFVRVILRYWDRTLELAVDTAAQAHHRCFIIKPRETNFRPFANAQRSVGLFTHRDLAMKRQIWLTPIGGAVHNVLFMQSPVLHEFGHTLGLGHIGGSDNGERAYGATLAAPPRDPRPHRAALALHGAGGRAPADQLLGLRLGS